MQKANALVAIGGNRGYTVPKYGITPSEAAVLVAIHGEASVFEIDVLPGDEAIRHRDERQRLMDTYPVERDGVFVVAELFPGAAARMFETFEEVGFGDSAFTLPSLEARAAQPQEGADLEDMTKAELLAFAKDNEIEVDANAKKADVLAAIIEAQGEDDGIGDMPDAGLLS